jgi:integrase
MRQGEILGLTWDAVDLDAGTLRVRVGLQRVDGMFQLVDTKSPQSRRAVDLPRSLVRALKAHKQRQNEARLLTGPRWQDHNLVFCTRWGKPFDGPNVTRYTQRVLKDAGLSRLTFHELRHSCGSLLAAQGVPDHEIARLLGHSDVRLTLNKYVHAYDEGRRRVAEAMDGLLGDEGTAALGS